MNARDLAAIAGQLAIALKYRRATLAPGREPGEPGVQGSDEELTNAILRDVGGDAIDLRPFLTRLRRSNAREAARCRSAGNKPARGLTSD